MKHGYVILGLVLMCLLGFASQVMAEDLCALVKTHLLIIKANGYDGNDSNIYSAMSATKQADGSYTFSTEMKFENGPADDIEGTCKDRHIIFTRTGSVTQTFDGWIFERKETDASGSGKREMAGVFSANGQTKWGWYGHFEPVAPK